MHWIMKILHKDIADVVAKAQARDVKHFIGDWRNIKPFLKKSLPLS